MCKRFSKDFVGYILWILAIFLRVYKSISTLISSIFGKIIFNFLQINSDAFPIFTTFVKVCVWMTLKALECQEQIFKKNIYFPVDNTAYVGTGWPFKYEKMN